MSAWQRWLHHPESLWLRQCFFHLHVWVGIATGIYVALMSVSGGIIVYRNEVSSAFARKPVVVNASDLRMSLEELKDHARQIHPGYRTSEVLDSRQPDQPVTLVLERGGKRMARLFNPYTGADLGDPDSAIDRAMDWVVDLHENLLAGHAGRLVNGIGAICVTFLCLTGAIIWWPGIRDWRRALTVNWRSPFARVNWDLHSAMGFWFFFFVLLWGVSGMYFCFPQAFNALPDFLQPNPRPGKLGFFDIGLSWLSNLHFGRFNRLTEAIWTAFALVPAALAFTGVFLCCHRMIYRKSVSQRESHEHTELPITSR